MAASNHSALPLVSILIPVYNGGNFLASAIESALAQTYPRIEILVINDGSADNGETARVAQRYGKKVRYFEKQNGGCGSALNFGIERMRGEYFSWLSHDDLYDSTKVDLQIRYSQALAEDPRFGAVCSAYRVWYTDADVKHTQPNFSASEFNRCKFYGLFRGAMNGNCLIIHRRVFDDIGLFDESQRATQDYDFFYRMLKRYDIFYHDDVLVTARIHSQQDTIAHNSLHLLESDRLWSTFMDESEPLGIAGCEPSPLLYWMKFANHLAFAPYPIAREKVFSKLFAALEAHRLARTPLVSVVLPFAELDGRTLSAAKSAFMQTYRHMEFIFAPSRPVPATSVEKLERLARIFDRTFTIVPADDRPGTAHARNRALDAATGELIAFIDPDDVWHPSKVDRQAAFFDADATLEVCSTAWLEGYLQPGSLASIDSIYRSRDEFINVVRPRFPVSTIMIRSTDHRFDESLAACEDLLFFGGLMSSGKFGHVPLRLAGIRLTETLPPDLAADFDARSTIWSTFSETGAVSRDAIEDLRFAYVKGAVARLHARDLRFLFRNTRHIVRRMIDRHQVGDVAAHVLREARNALARRMRHARAKI